MARASRTPCWAAARPKGYLFADRGITALKGFEEPVRLYELKWDETL